MSEIKEFCSKDKILLGIGNSIIVDEYRKEIEKLGGKIEVEENRPITNSKPTEQAERCRTLSAHKKNEYENRIRKLSKKSYSQRF